MFRQTTGVCYINNIMDVLKVETEIIISITASPTGGAVIQVIFSVETFKMSAIFLSAKLCDH